MQTGTQTQNFIEALTQLELSRQIEPMLELYAPDCELWTLTHKEPLCGTEEIEKFWQTYLGHFETIESEFVRVIVDENRSALEWRAHGTLRQGGEAITYWGVTLLDFDDEGITRFASYYDMQPFVKAEGLR